MPVYLFDSSALVKRYVREVGSVWVDSLLHPAAGNEIHIVRIAAVEVTAALTRRSRGGGLTPILATSAIARFRRDLTTTFRIVEITPALIADAMDLSERHGLRGYDAVQLAGALHVAAGGLTTGSPVTLVSADTELNAAAFTEGLQVDDPNTHP